MTTKQERVEHANQLIRVISEHGRRFFYNKEHDRVACMRMRMGRVYFVDDYSGKVIYTHWTPFGNKWQGFTHGGTLRSLVERMRDYIMKGEKIPLGFIAPTYMDSELGDMWGYGRLEAYNLRRRAEGLPIIRSDKVF